MNRRFMMKKMAALLTCMLAVAFFANADDLVTGEWALEEDGTPAMTGQMTQDHLFVRGSYNDMGEMEVYDNVVSFKSDALQTVWLWFDDDMIYQNAKVQALPPSLIKDNGEPYNEITYNSFQITLYLPEGIEMVKCEDEQGNEVSFVQGDRMPNSTIFRFSADTVTKVIDGVVYRPYTLIAYNLELNGSHFSSRNATAYQANGALKKNDAPVLGIFLKNTNQDVPEGRLADIILANQEFCMIEPLIVDPKWEPNDYRFVYGEGGNNESQRYQFYNRIELYGSKGFGDDEILVSQLSLNYNSKVMQVGETLQLTATVLPNDATNKTLTWTTSNPNVATVNSEGVVTAVGAGSATITAKTTDGSNLSATCTVAVYVPASAITLNTNDLTLKVNETSQLVATVLPSNTTNKRVTWASSDPSVVTVTSNGLVRAIAPGSATITVTTTDGTNLSATCAVTVYVPASAISLNTNNLTLGIDETSQLVAYVYPSNTTNKQVTWESSDPSVATVTSNGLVRAIAPGSATITVTTTDGTNLSATCAVTVYVPASAISLNTNNLTLGIDETSQLVAYVYPSNTTNKQVTWESSDPSVATVTSNGLVRAIAPGTATVTARTTDGSNLSASCLVTVEKRLITSLSLNQSKVVMYVGETAQLLAEIAPENASDKTLAWTSASPTVASVDNNGLVTGIAGGTTYVTVSTTDGSNLTASCEIEVIPDYYVTLDTLSHIRGYAAQVIDLPVTLVNHYPISGVQFDVSLPADVSFNLIDGKFDVWLDKNRGTRTHSITVTRLSTGKYRIHVSSSSSMNLIGYDGELVHMNMLLPQLHNSGDYTIGLSNILAIESNQARHSLEDASTQVHFYYLVGDADANALIDVADHNATASKILGKSPSPFYRDAANVDGNTKLDVVDLVGISNIALEINPITVRQAPARGSVANKLFCDNLRLNADGEGLVNIGLDCGFSFAGFQMDMELPHGLTLVAATLGDQASAFGLATESMPDGLIRILGTSFSDAEVSGHCPQLLSLKVKADRSYQHGSNIQFSDVLFAERDLTGHDFDGSCIEYVDPSAVYELNEDARIYVEDGNIIVETPVSGTVQLITVDGRMIEHQAHEGRNVYAVNATGIFIIHFNGKTLKVRL